MNGDEFGEQNSPPPGQGNDARTVPLHVLAEERERRRALERELDLVKGMVNDLRAERQVGKEATRDKLDEYIDHLDDDSKKAVDAFFEKKFAGERQQIGAAIRTVLDRNDILELKLVAGSNYDAYSKKVEAEIAEMKRAGVTPPPRHVIYSNLKTKEAAEKYEKLEQNSRAKAREVYGDPYAQEARMPQGGYQDHFSNLNDSSAAPPAAKPRKSFKEMTLAEKEAALANIEI